MINLALFPIVYIDVRTYLTNPESITEQMLLVLKPIAFIIGGILLYRLIYGRLSKGKRKISDTFKFFIGKYGWATLCGILICFCLTCNVGVLDSLTEGIFHIAAEGQVSYYQFPPWKIFVIENTFTVLALFSYLMFLIAFFWQKSKAGLEASRP